MGREGVLVADDHGVVTAGVKAILEPEFEVIETVEDGRALVTAADQLRPDIIVADISMPLVNGIEATRHIKKADPKAKVIILTVHEDVARSSRRSGPVHPATFSRNLPPANFQLPSGRCSKVGPTSHH